MTRPTIADNVRLERQLEQAKLEALNWKSKYKYVSKELKAADARANFLADVGRVGPYKELKKIKGSGEATGVLILSDWHSEERVEPKTINGLNAFDLKICKKRVEAMFQRSLMMLDAARGLTTIDTLVVAALGDFITGYIHQELEENNYLSPVEACLFASDLLVNGLRFLKREGGFSEIIVPTCFGNHGRTQDKKRCSSGYANSFEWLMYKNLEKHLQEPGIRFKVVDSYFNWLTIQNHKVRFSHGDNIKYAGGVGGITIPVNKAIAQWNKVDVADYDYFGHYHQSINNNRWTCNGSVIGYNAYALAIKAEYEVPSQTISIISKTRGKILTDRVFCD